MDFGNHKGRLILDIYRVVLGDKFKLKICSTPTIKICAGALH